MHFPWSLVGLGLTYGLGYGLRPLIEHVKRDSARWQERPARQRRVLTLLPGGVLGFAISGVLLLLFGY